MKHPIHPALVHFPIACWSLGSLADIVYWVVGLNTAQVAVMLIAAGTVLALPTMLSGLLELTKLEADSQVQSVAMTHMYLVLVSWSLYAVTLFLRMQHSGKDYISMLEVILSAAGFAALSIAGYYGGKLVYEHGVGVRRDIP